MRNWTAIINNLNNSPKKKTEDQDGLSRISPSHSGTASRGMDESQGDNEGINNPSETRFVAFRTKENAA
jgi:hypothetical protein